MDISLVAELWRESLGTRLIKFCSVTLESSCHSDLIYLLCGSDIAEFYFGKLNCTKLLL